MIITIFTDGDATKLSTWSNVPYFLSTTLENKGHIVNRVNTSSFALFKKLYNHTISKFLNLFYPNHAYQFERTRFYNWIINNKIQKEIRKTDNADLFIIMDFSFYNECNNIPTITFSDWSYEYYIKERCKRNPYFFEYSYLRRQAEALKKATVVVSLFELCANYIKRQSPTSNVKFLGGNVINMMRKPTLHQDKIIEAKRNNISILFIGMKKYQSGAQLLVDTFPLIKQKYPHAKLHIVGLTNNDLYNLSEGIACYGYLHKDNPQECQLYYNLLEKATVFVNPTEQWAGYSSMIEAMYFYTPIVVSPYEEFTNEFGKSITFGIYNTDFNVNTLANSILKILQNERYDYFCIKAHERVKDYTWDNYVEHLLQII